MIKKKIKLIYQKFDGAAFLKHSRRKFICLADDFFYPIELKHNEEKAFQRYRRKKLARAIFSKIKAFYTTEVKLAQGLFWCYKWVMAYWNFYCRYEASWYEFDHDARFYRDKFYKDAGRFCRWLYFWPRRTIRRLYWRFKLRKDPVRIAAWQEENKILLNDLALVNATIRTDYSRVKIGLRIYFKLMVLKRSLKDSDFIDVSYNKAFADIIEYEEALEKLRLLREAAEAAEEEEEEEEEKVDGDQNAVIEKLKDDVEKRN